MASQKSKNNTELQPNKFILKLPSTPAPQFFLE